MLGQGLRVWEKLSACSDGQVQLEVLASYRGATLLAQQPAD
jgi:hypothetical protein